MMKRRTFLRTSVLAPFAVKDMLLGSETARARFIHATPKSFDYLEVKGTYERTGYQIGKFFGKHIKKIIKQRSDWHGRLMSIMESRKGRLYANELLQLTRRYFPHLHRELQGIAEGAGIGFDALWAMCIKSELDQCGEETPGCSTIFYKDKKRAWLFHNEDGHRAYGDIMYIARVTPPSGISFISMVYPGIIAGNGPNLNSEGLIQTTNYIGSTRGEAGIPRYVISRAVLEAKNIKEALQIITFEPRAYPSHHNIASLSDGRYVSIETVPGLTEKKEPETLYYHTNHLIFDQTRAYPYEDMTYRGSSSESRYEVIREKVKTLDLEKPESEDFLAILASHEHTVKPYSPCRHPTDTVPGTTLGTAYFDLKEGFFRLFKGNPCEALKKKLYVDFRF